MSLLREYLLDLLINQWSFEQRFGELLVSFIMVISWLIIGFIVSLVVKKILNRMMLKRRRAAVKREKTVAALVISVSRFFFWFYIIVMILSELGIDIVPVLASAGILVFAVGFGAQEMIKDFISGFFLIFEHAFDVGDVVEIGGFKGTVLEIGLRRTKMKNSNNEVRVINNGDIRALTNFSLDISVGIVDLVVPRSFDSEVFKSDEFKHLLLKFEDYEHVLTAPAVVGITNADHTSYTLRVSFKTENNKQFSIERSLREEIIEFIRVKREESLK